MPFKVRLGGWSALGSGAQPRSSCASASKLALHAEASCRPALRRRSPGSEMSRWPCCTASCSASSLLGDRCTGWRECRPVHCTFATAVSQRDNSRSRRAKTRCVISCQRAFSSRELGSVLHQLAICSLLLRRCSRHAFHASHWHQIPLRNADSGCNSRRPLRPGLAGRHFGPARQASSRTHTTPFNLAQRASV
jgi:hypothetical protein